jgi:hypothetical protein
MSGEWREEWLLPRFSVSVASKGFIFPVSSLESTLMGIFVSVADKGVRGMFCVARLEGPATPSGMSRKPNRDAKNAQTAHLQV